MNRRRFLLGSTALAVAGRAPSRLLAAAPTDPWAAAFAAARRTDRSLMGYDSAPLGGFRCAEAPVEGQIPAGLAGVLLRTGPARHEVGGTRYHHWFDGDGMVQRFAIAGGKVSHLGRYVETPKLVEEIAAAGMVERAFGTVLPTMRPPRRPDAMNVANISVISHAGRVMALWEGGSAVEIDPADLATKGFVRWSTESAGLPFSAHPRRDRDGSLWNIGAPPGAGKLVLYHIDAAGGLVSLDLLDVPRDAGMIHDFVLTERHVLVPLPSLAIDAARFQQGSSLLDSYQWRPEQPFRFLIIDKASRASRGTAELPPGFVYHFGNGWEDASGTVRVDACWYEDFTFTTERLRYVMRGEHRAASAARAAFLTIDTTAGRASIEKSSDVAELPRFDERLATRRARHTFTVAPVAEGAPAAVMRRDRDNGAVDRFGYGPHIEVEEHVFVPRGESEGDGWLIGTSLDWQAGRTRFAVFEAQRLADGPVALATLPYALPLGLHGSWRPA